METVLNFNLNGIIRQEVTIVAKDLTPEQLADGLERGIFQTSIAHDGVETVSTTITETNTGMIVARINKQTVIGEADHDYYIQGFNVEDTEL